MLTYEEFRKNLDRVEADIAKACAEVGRRVEEVRILAITKTHPAEVLEFVQKAGLHAVGESRVQEAAQKKENTKISVQWELIGHLQSNKAGLAVEVFDRIQSVDSTKLLAKIDHAASVLHKPMRVLLQVNAANDPSKFGVQPHHATGLLECALHLKHIKVEGLMTIGELTDNKLVTQEAFGRLRALRDHLEEKMGVRLPELSMGMSRDLAEAVKAGSTLVRVGSALFGGRDLKSDTFLDE